LPYAEKPEFWRLFYSRSPASTCSRAPVTQLRERAALREAVAPFETPSLALGLGQIVTSIVFYIAAVGTMYWSFGVSYALTLLLAIPASVFLVRVFIVQHDCGHGSFLAWRRGNDLLGATCGVLTLVPYANWRRQHAGHHANWNNLDRRESGADIYSTCLTVSEYRALSPPRRFFYRLWRHPVMANILFPHLVFLLLYRTPFDTPKSWIRERKSVWTTNLAILTVFVALGLSFGFVEVLMVQLPIVFVTSVIGVWLFSVQHRFEDARWMRRGEWNFADAALHGSSYLALPRFLQWMTGNIGFHHIHHLSQRIPNYRLAACHRGNPALHPESPLTLLGAVRAARFTLWDEESGRLVRFCDARTKRQNEDLSRVQIIPDIDSILSSRAP
jgi:acyl-lipid omega-6 desaturase (Delta-12 desaturase)